MIVNPPAVVYDYTPTRERAGPEKFLQGYRGYLQADAYSAYDHFFVNPERGMVEVGCWAHYPESAVIQSDSSRPRSFSGPVVLLSR